MDDSQGNIDGDAHSKSRVKRRFRLIGRPYLDAREQQLKVAFGEISGFLMLLLFVVFLIWLGLHHTVDIGASLVHSFSSPIELKVCNDLDAIKHLQSEQLRKARIEVFGRNRKAGYSLFGDDSGFYALNFGAMTVNGRRYDLHI